MPNVRRARFELKRSEYPERISIESRPSFLQLLLLSLIPFREFSRNRLSLTFSFRGASSIDKTKLTNGPLAQFLEIRVYNARNPRYIVGNYLKGVIKLWSPKGF